MAVDAFLQFTKTGATGIVLKGETRDQEMSKKDPPPFEIKDWNFSVANVANIGSGTGGAGTGKAKFEGFNVTKNVDTASAFCFLTCCAGGHFDQVTLYIRKAGSTANQSGVTYLQFDYKMVGVENISWKNGEEAPEETVLFKYGALKITYYPQDQSGAVGKLPPISSQWDQVLNEASFDAGLG
jgi:type VI secretion system secreted protein Hcp